MRNIFKLSDGKFVKEAATLVGSPGISVFTIPGTSFRIDPMEIMRDVVKVLYSDINRAGIKKINVSSIPVSNILGLAKYQPRKENGVYVDSERDTIHVDVKKIFENYAKKPLAPTVQTDFNRSKDPDFIKNLYMKVLNELRYQLAFVTRHEIEHKIRTLRNISQNKSVSDNPEYDADQAGKNFADRYVQRH